MNREVFNNKQAAVNMVEQAKSVQEGENVRTNTSMLKIMAPAKINLFLGVGKRMENGYHEVESVIHSLALHDMLYMKHISPEAFSEGAFSCAQFLEDDLAYAGPEKNIVVHLALSFTEGLEPTTIPCKENLVFLAIDALAHELDVRTPQAFDVRLEKHIPAQAGLGGGSADAAAALIGAAKFFGLTNTNPTHANLTNADPVHANLTNADPTHANLPHINPTLERVARKLGSDVAFFLYGGCAYFDGTGDNFLHTLEPLKTSIVLIKPDVGISTRAAYETFDENPQPIKNECLIQARAATSAHQVLLTNNLEDAAKQLSPELEEIWNWLSEQEGQWSGQQADQQPVQQPGKQTSARNFLLSGSGSASFILLDSFECACKIVAAAKARGWWARTTQLSSAKAALIERF